MIVGTLRIQLVIRGCRSLKEKRRVIKGLKSALADTFNIAVAETDHQDVWQSAEIGIATVGTDTPFVDSVLSNVVNHVRFHGGVELVDYATETWGE